MRDLTSAARGLRLTSLAYIEKIAPRGAIVAALESKYATEGQSAAADAAEFSAADADEIDRLKDLASDAPVIRLVHRLIDQAVVRSGHIGNVL